ncbi:hypothetical protein GTR04_4066 [Trichophyton interdigitale]|uniref:Uncharacterized protein n=1 Tax=Trichophyton interdigitale TaxID=101480 RepID=A0A9P4YHD8_9EURO|nr:hypothetical protein GY631_3810 [Trichophyton interdigitale]KAF3894879.1 hypothetical protein GY632_3533 [Trichophyton interdigitale]KAG8208555.1 hypothetical protein GTR04_4066 [Trichophyton interdigitale]
MAGGNSRSASSQQPASKPSDSAREHRFVIPQRPQLPVPSKISCATTPFGLTSLCFLHPFPSLLKCSLLHAYVNTTLGLSKR